MTVIKNLAFLNKNKLKNLNSFVESELNLSVFYPFPIDFFHHFLPFNLKFLNESFVSIDNKKINGLVTVNKTGKKRVKITRLLLDENSVESGKLLINCVVTLFLSKGAESFYVVVDKLNTPLIKMFQDGCGFINYAKEIIYRIDNSDLDLGYDDINFEHIRKISHKDTKYIKELINSLVNSYQKPAFYKNASELRKSLLYSTEQFVVFEREKNEILGYFTILKLNHSDYILDFVIKRGYEGYVSDIIRFAKIKLYKNKNFKTLFVKLKSYYSNFGELNEMFNMEYKASYENAILVKDYMVTKKQEFTYEKMIFNDITPAF